MYIYGITQLCPTLCNPMDCSPPGSSVHGILQARILEWFAIYFVLQAIFPTQGWNRSYSNRRQFFLLSERPEKPSILEWVAVPFSRGIFTSQGSNPGLPHYSQILYQLSHQGSLIHIYRKSLCCKLKI